jgi:transcriptional regulator with GAF, ATPase, and Fis domain
MSMQTTVWVHRLGSMSHGDSVPILRKLEEQSISTRPLGQTSPDGPGVVLFDRMEERVLDGLRDLSRFGEFQTLAIQTDGAALDHEVYWALLRAGASDVLRWSATDQAARTAAARLMRWRQVDELVNSPLVRDNLVGCSPSWNRALRRIVEAARFSDAPVLVMGESGTGKELVARLIHTLDPRSDKKDLVVLDCTTIVPELSGSEFFGHERGAFTGAVGPREGAFELANRSTLFLDEIGELPLVLQAQLLRAVQERKYKRVGGNAWFNTEFRLICATNRDLEAEIIRGRFRADLYYRIASWVCRLPPLRERPEDICLIVDHFLSSENPKRELPQLSEPVRSYLLRRAYPGNVRELRQLVTRMLGRHVGDAPITVGDIPEDERPGGTSTTADWRDAEFERIIRRAMCMGVGLRELSNCAAETAIRIAVGEENGNLQRAACRLGVTARALQMRRANSRS